MPIYYSNSANFLNVDEGIAISEIQRSAQALLCISEIGAGSIL
jgi:hypothetical protein